MLLKKTAVALALSLGLVAGANAVVSPSNLVMDVGLITAPASFSQIIQHGIGAFSDQWKFNFASNTFSGGSVSNLSINIPGLGNLYDIAGLSVKLYNGDTNTLLSNLDNNPGSTSDLKVGSGVFAPGNYYFTVAGNATGLFGGQYVFAASTLPVPEPESYAMLLVGLGLLSVVARRRGKASE